MKWLSSPFGFAPGRGNDSLGTFAARFFFLPFTLPATSFSCSSSTSSSQSHCSVDEAVEIDDDVFVEVVVVVVEVVVVIVVAIVEIVELVVVVVVVGKFEIVVVDSVEKI